MDWRNHTEDEEPHATADHFQQQRRRTKSEGESLAEPKQVLTKKRAATNVSTSHPNGNGKTQSNNTNNKNSNSQKNDQKAVNQKNSNNKTTHSNSNNNNPQQKSKHPHHNSNSHHNQHHQQQQRTGQPREHRKILRNNNNNNNSNKQHVQLVKQQQQQTKGETNEEKPESTPISNGVNGEYTPSNVVKDDNRNEIKVSEEKSKLETSANTSQSNTDNTVTTKNEIPIEVSQES